MDMKTISRLFMMILLAMPMAFVSCDDDEDYYYGHPGWVDGDHDGDDRPGNGLNQYEKALVGSYVSDDDPTQPFYLVLNNDRTGSYKSVGGGQTKGESFTWCANDRKLTVTFDSDGAVEDMEYYYANNHLYVDGIPLVPNDGNTGQPETTAIVGQWQGKINGYYEAVWGQANGDFQSVLEFTADGSGCQLDYNPYTPKTDFAYTPFTWMQTADAVTIAYQSDSQLSAVRISEYALTSAKFSGTLAYGAQTFTFSFDKVTGFDWSPYRGMKTRAGLGRMKAARTAKSGIVRRGVFAKVG